MSRGWIRVCFKCQSPLTDDDNEACKSLGLTNSYCYYCRVQGGHRLLKAILGRKDGAEEGNHGGVSGGSNGPTVEGGKQDAPEGYEADIDPLDI